MTNKKPFAKWLSFSVPFVAGKARPRFDYRSRRAYTDRLTKEKEKLLQYAFLQASKPYSIDLTQRVEIQIEVQKPLQKSVSKKIEMVDDLTKPDIDNVAKLVLDALNGVAYRDDAQVTSLKVVKKPRTRAITEQQTKVFVFWLTPETIETVEVN